MTKQKKGVEFLDEQVKLANNVMNQFNEQIDGFDDIMNSVIDSASPEQRRELSQFRIMANNAISKAKKGDSSFQDVVEQMKKQFKQPNTNGSNNNG